MSAAALLLSAVGAYAAQQKYYFLYEEGHEDQPETSWFILDREAKKYIPDSCGDDELTVKNYKKSGNTETFDCYDNSYFTHSVIMKKNDKGQTVVQISYEKGKTNGRKIVCGTEAEYDKYWEEYRAKNGGDGGSTSTSSNPVDKATKKVKSGFRTRRGITRFFFVIILFIFTFSIFKQNQHLKCILPETSQYNRIFYHKFNVFSI